MTDIRAWPRGPAGSFSWNPPELSARGQTAGRAAATVTPAAWAGRRGRQPDTLGPATGGPPPGTNKERDMRGHGKCVLVVDGGAARGILVSVLARLGADAVAAASGADAVRLVGERPGRFGVVLMDARAAGVDGAATLAALRAADPDVRCCLTGGDPGGWPAGAVDLGPVAFLPKPFAFRQLASALQAAARGGASTLVQTEVQRPAAAGMDTAAPQVSQ